MADQGALASRRSIRSQRAFLLAIIAVAAMAAGLATWSRRPPAVEPPASTPPSVQFAVIGDYGTDNTDEAGVATMVAADTPDFVVTVGDNTYGSRTVDTAVGKYYADFIGNYQGAHGSGSPTNRFFPALGNHDINDGGGLPAYLSFFTLPGAGISSIHPSGNERYYDFVQGPVHFFVLDSDPSEPNGISAGSSQASWLRNGLAASPSPWNVVVMHHAPFSSSSSHGSNATLQWPFEAWGADLVLAGHDHTYERIVRDDNADGTPLTYVVDGLGGRAQYGFAATPVAGSQVRYNADHGALFIDASETSLTGEFRTVGGATPDTFALTAPAPGHITGTVTSGGTPVSGALVHAIDYRANPAAIRGDVTDAAGQYDIEVPAPDLYAVAVLEPTATYAFEYHEDNPTIDPADDVSVAPGASVTVDVDLAGSPSALGTIAGTVRDGVDRVPGAWVIAVSQRGDPRATVADESGDYSIAGLPAGTYHLMFSDPSGDHVWEWHENAMSWLDAVPVTLSPGATVTVSATLAPAP